MKQYFGQHSEYSWADQPAFTFIAALAETLFTGYIVKEIALTQGKVALVDDEDYEELSKFKWYAAKNRKTWYVARAIGKRPHQRQVLMHREILGAQPGEQCDHINGDGLDNRRCNLRFCTNSQNQMNRRIYGGTSRFKGVMWNKRHKMWYAQIKHDGKQYHLGCFHKQTDAAHAYDTAARNLFGEFARLNFPRETIYAS